MTGRAKRLTFIGAATLAAMVAMGIVPPSLATAARKPKPPDPKAFVIEVSEECWVGGYIGEFVATGAIEDTGMAMEAFSGNVVSLDGDLGDMQLEIKGRRFRIIYGDGAYASLVGVKGSHYTPGGVPTSWIYRRFEGTVPK